MPLQNIFFRLCPIIIYENFVEIGPELVIAISLTMGWKRNKCTKTVKRIPTVAGN